MNLQNSARHALQRLRPGVGLLVLMVAMPAAALALRTPPEVVPEGVWWMRTEVSSVEQTRAFSDLNSDSPLLHLLVPDTGTRADLSGDVTRRITRLDWQATYGLSDEWNLVLGLPYAQVKQQSTLVAGATAPAQEAAQRLDDLTVSGAGRLEVGSLHRPIFSDRNGFIVAYGLQWPISTPDEPWAGRFTPLPDSPFPRTYGRLQYTRYLLSTRARLDLNAEIGIGWKRSLDLAEGGSTDVAPGNDLAATLGWGQEFGPVQSGVAVRIFRQGMTSLRGQVQGDDVEELSGHLVLGFGNLRDLESGPLAFPYSLQVAYDHSFAGRNTPVRRDLRFSLAFYF